ncbi:hypothetical protein EVAR_55411_1 [Eumeta japonica]|uniref:Uncharacterized protein n=1 Tax=Eumeta variegata TaxID=151549 RepID=A0A4C1YNC2_EUMVA|nr:hypothetical protein EVAR_55411_1 [Eumeta japonica]
MSNTSDAVQGRRTKTCTFFPPHPYPGPTSGAPNALIPPTSAEGHLRGTPRGDPFAIKGDDRPPCALFGTIRRRKESGASMDARATARVARSE